MKARFSLIAVLLSFGCADLPEDFDASDDALDTEEATVTGADQAALLKGLCLPEMRTLTQPMNDDVSVRFDPTALCPLRSAVVTGISSERTDAVIVSIAPEQPPPSGGKRATNFTRVTYTISGKRWVLGISGGRPTWTERWDVIHTESTTRPLSYRYVAEGDYLDLRVEAQASDIRQLCFPELRPTPDGGYIPTGKETCEPEQVVGKKAIKVDFWWEYTYQEQ